MAIQWSKASCLELIQLYEQQQVLWNRKHDEYYVKEIKELAWNKIGDQLNISAEEARKKMVILLGSFRREKAKTRKYSTSPEGEPITYESKWFAFRSFQFLLDRDECSGSQKDNPNNIKEDDNDEIEFEVTEFHELEYQSYETSYNPLGENVHQLEISNKSDKYSNTKYDSESSASSTKTTSTVNIADRVADQRTEEILPILKALSAASIPNSDSCNVYGQHIANKLRNYKPKTRALVEHAINNILFQADMGIIEEKSTRPNQSLFMASNHLTQN